MRPLARVDFETRLCAASRPVAARADKTSLLMETQTISSHLQLSISLEQIHPARVLLNVWCGGFSSHLELFTPRDSPFSTSPQLLDTSHNLCCICWICRLTRGAASIDMPGARTGHKQHSSGIDTMGICQTGALCCSRYAGSFLFSLPKCNYSCSALLLWHQKVKHALQWRKNIIITLSSSKCNFKRLTKTSGNFETAPKLFDL